MFREVWPSYLLALVLVFISSVVSAEQLTLQNLLGKEHKLCGAESPVSNGEVIGELRQYPFGKDILAELRRHEVDIWRLTPTTIDAYFTTTVIDDHSILSKYNYTLLSNPFFANYSQTDEDTEEDMAHASYCGLRKHKKYPLFNLTLLSHDFHEQYHTYANISRFIKSLAHTFPNEAKLVNIGHSYEGRKITGLKIAKSDPVPNGAKHRKAFVIMGAQHAREWIASSTALYIAHALLIKPSDQTGTDSRHSLRRLLEHFEFHIIPLPNPDGYAYTRKRDRLWYKNRQPVTAVKGKACKGMDMNRNWGFEWMPATDPSSDPCGHWYPGSRPFEAHEVNALASYLTYRTGPRGHVVAFLDLRSYGQMLSAPYSYTCEVYPADAEDQIEAALGAAQAGSRVHGISISTGRLCETLYSAPGNIVDWAYGSTGVKYSYAAHLRDTGTYGFLIPPDWIRPTGEETAALVGYLATFIAKDPKTMR